ncbi:MAG: hypothetical protein A2V79_03865 [Betaproteobacteria bacterium RBG_16_56_24]|nr:MAG: hypothetical protein A2V79_03865 [Betaproteobacteria bacterium RBG_16_56_24]
MRDLPADSKVATVACHIQLSNLSQDSLKHCFANLPFEKSIFVYSQNLWTTLLMVLHDSALMWRGIRDFVTLPIFYETVIIIKNKWLS